VDQAEALRWPSFAIGGTLGLSALSGSPLGHSASGLSSLLGSISLPLLDGGARRAQVRAQQAALDQAREAYRAAVLLALQQVEDSLVALRADRARATGLRDATQAASAAAQLASLRYRSGLSDFQAVLETQRTLFTTQDAALSAQADVGSDDVRLFTALGGGWPAASLAQATP
jgi:outer membrane protein TolC